MDWRRIKTLIWKEFVQIRRDKSMLPMLLIMPIIQLLVFGYVAGGDVRNMPMAVLDSDQTLTSSRIVSAFTESGYYTQVATPVDDAAMKESIDSGAAQVALVIPKGLEADVQAKRATRIGVIVDGSDAKGQFAQFVNELMERHPESVWKEQ